MSDKNDEIKSTLGADGGGSSGDDDKPIANPICCPRPHPQVLDHSDIEEIFPNVYFVQGTVKLSGAASPIPMTFGRNMTIIRDSNNDLILFNTIRMDHLGLHDLDTLGTVKHIVKLASFHGMDDPFYKERYPNATVWAPKDTTYFANFDIKSPPYFIPDEYYDNGTIFPFLQSTPKEGGGKVGAKAIVITSSKVPEGLVLVDTLPEGKIMISGDCFQNFQKRCGDPYGNCCSNIMMWYFGFHKPCNVGPAWYGQMKPNKQDIIKILESTKFDHVFPAHGNICLGNAYQKYGPSVHALQEHEKRQTVT